MTCIDVMPFVEWTPGTVAAATLKQLRSFLYWNDANYDLDGVYDDMDALRTLALEEIGEK